MKTLSHDGEIVPASAAPSNRNLMFGGANQGDQPSLTEEYIRTLVRYRRAMFLFALAGLLVALVIGLNTEPIYRTRTSLDIRSINNDFLNMRAVATTGNGSSGDSDTNLQTQIRLLQSDTLIQQVIDHLLAEPHPAVVPKSDLLSQTLRSIHLGGRETIPYTLLVNDTAQRVKVKPLGLTRLVEITCDSWDASFAASFCNTLSSTFEQEDLKSRAAEAQKTSEWLTRQAADIRQRAEDAQKRLEAAVGGNGLMLSTLAGSPGEDRLRQLQDEYVKAQAARMDRQANDTVARTAQPDTLSAVQDNPAYRAYQLKLADLNAELVKLVPPLTEENPRVIRLRAEVAEAEAGMESARLNSTGRQDNEFAAARHREDLLRMTYDAQVASVSSDLQKAAQVSLLRREVDSEQQLYQTLLQRAKEAGFASAMNAATIRVIDAARVPRLPFSPQRLLSGMAGLGVGLFFGVGFAFFKDRHQRVFRSPGDVERHLQVHELGVIPTAERLQTGRLFSLRAANVPESGPDLPPLSDAVQLTRWNDDFSILAEAFRSVTFSLMLAESQKRARTYVISSPSSGEGKTTITTNVGIALGKSKLRVALIDGDLRRPSLHRAFNIDNGFGLRNILRGEVDLSTIPTEILTHRTWVPNIVVIPAGEGAGDVAELLYSPYFKPLLERLEREFDVILIDTPPMLHMADARILATHADGAILVFRASQTMRDEAATACNLFGHDGVHVVGTILNGFDPTSEGKADYYKSYYRYRTASEEDEEKAVTGR